MTLVAKKASATHEQHYLIESGTDTLFYKFEEFSVSGHRHSIICVILLAVNRAKIAGLTKSVAKHVRHILNGRNNFVILAEMITKFYLT